MFGALYRLLIAESRLGRRLRHRRRFPGLGVHDFAELRVEGDFRYGAGASIGSWSVVQVPPGARLSLGNGAYLGRNVEVAPSGAIEIGDRTSIQDRSVFLGDVVIGRYCTIAYGAYGSSGNHRFDLDPAALIKDQDALAAGELRKRIVIEDDCWIGNGVFVAAGVRIGKGSVVGANSVVTRDVPPYTIAAGAPARALRQRLVFQPPGRIRHDRKEDLPYFYSGFRVADDERAQDRSLGGLVATGAFALALDSARAKRVHVRIRSLSEIAQALSLGGESRLLGQSFADADFPFPVDAASRLEFALSAPGPVCVEGAWVE